MQTTEIITKYFCDLCGGEHLKEDLKEFSRHYTDTSYSGGFTVSAGNYVKADVCRRCGLIKSMQRLDDFLDSKISGREMPAKIYGTGADRIIPVSVPPQWEEIR